MDGMAAPFNDTNVSWSATTPMGGSVVFSLVGNEYIGYAVVNDLSQEVAIHLAGNCLDFGQVLLSGCGILRKQFRLLTIGSETKSTW